MKIATLRKLQTRWLRRRNRAQRDYTKARRNRARWGEYGSLDLHAVRLDTEVTVLDKVLDDLDRLIARNHDHFQARKRK